MGPRDTLSATANAPRSQHDLYTPRWVKGRGPTKVCHASFRAFVMLTFPAMLGKQVGICPVCAESPARGGEGTRVWLSMKFSAFKWCAKLHTFLPHISDVAHRVPLPLCLFRNTDPPPSYHMQYYHGASPRARSRPDMQLTSGHTGISSAGVPFSPPTAFRRVARPHAGKHEKRAVEQGRCHRCRAWVNVEGVKDVGVKVRASAERGGKR